MTGDERPGITLDELKARLTDRLEELAVLLLGQPNRDTTRKAEWRWGAKGSTALVVTSRVGKLRGAFFSHEASSGGSPLDLVMHARACGVAEAIRWAKSWLGIADGEYTPSPASEQALQDRKTQRAAREAQAAKAAASKASYAEKLWNEAAPIAGTLAARYLTVTRHIPEPAGGWPDVLRFHARSKALILVATAADGAIQGVQRVYLTDQATKISDEETERRELPAGKHSNGAFEGAAVRLPGSAIGPLQLGEGPETGLSAWVSTGHETWIALGGFAKIEPQPGRALVLCRDDDRKHSPADNSLRKLVAAWRAKRIDARVATPWMARRYDRSDLNDTIQAQGVHGVQRRIDVALNPVATPVERVSIGQARTKLDQAIAEFFTAAAAYRSPNEQQDELDATRGRFPDGEPMEDATPAEWPVHAIKVDVGVGKTRAAYRYSLRLLREMRARGDQRAIAVAVPTHKLGDDQAETFAAIAEEAGANLVARVWRGMEAPDPDHPDFADERKPRDQKTKMCRNLEAVDAAREAMADVFQSACRRKSKVAIEGLGIERGDFITCPFFAECSYQAQREAVADVWIVPHELLFLQMPAALGKIAMLVVDESCWADGLEGTEGKPMSVPLHEMEHADRIIGSDGQTLWADTDRLAFLRGELLAGFAAQSNGPVLRDAMLDGHLSAANAGEAYRLEFRRWVDAGMHPRMSRGERQASIAAASGNARVLRVARIWKAMMMQLAEGGPEQSGWLTLDTEHDKKGDAYRALHTKRRKDVRTGWLVPTLILDATLNVDLLRPFWPQVQVTADVLAASPHQYVRQVIDRAYSKSMLEPLDAKEAEANQELASRRTRNLRTTHAAIMREARRFAPGRVLVVCQLAIKNALPDFGPMPPNVELAHHNAVAGRDEWRDVRALIVVGRTMPGVGAVNRQAEALTGAAVEHLVGGWYERGDAVREMAGGVAVAIESERHPDPIAEAIRWQVCEGELVQVIGRGRGVNRTAADPLDVLILTDAAVPVPVNETMSSADLDPSPADLMLAAGGVSFENGRHAHTAYPDLWPTWTAARQAILRAASGERSATSLSKKERSLLIEECRTPLTRVAYQVAGAGQKPAVAWCDLAVMPNPGGMLTGKLGTLAWLKVEPPTVEPDPDPPPPPRPTDPVDVLVPSVSLPAMVGRSNPGLMPPHRRPAALHGEIENRRTGPPVMPDRDDDGGKLGRHVLGDTRMVH